MQKRFSIEKRAAEKWKLTRLAIYLHLERIQWKPVKMSSAEDGELDPQIQVIFLWQFACCPSYFLPLSLSLYASLFRTWHWMERYFNDNNNIQAALFLGCLLVLSITCSSLQCSFCWYSAYPIRWIVKTEGIHCAKVINVHLDFHTKICLQLTSKKHRALYFGNRKQAFLHCISLLIYCVNLFYALLVFKNDTTAKTNTENQFTSHLSKLQVSFSDELFNMHCKTENNTKCRKKGSQRVSNNPTHFQVNWFFFLFTRNGFELGT